MHQAVFQLSSEKIPVSVCRHICRARVPNLSTERKSVIQRDDGHKNSKKCIKSTGFRPGLEAKRYIKTVALVSNHIS